jgi:hypothetical protein
MFNHFEFHGEISTKTGLLSNILVFSEKCKENAFNYLPLTFSFEYDPDKASHILDSFISTFNTLELHKDFPLILAKKKNTVPINITINGTLLKYSKRTMPLSHFAGHNLWILKPAELNRGRGIHIFNDIEVMKNFIMDHINETKKYKDVTSVSFVVQKYIERPLLINGRKFDIRVWVLLTHVHEFYLFREGYVRTSSVAFDINEGNLNDRFVHLTNNAIQKDSRSYGLYENGNQLSFFDFRNYIKDISKSELDFDKHIFTDIKNIVKKSMYAVRKKLDSENRKYTFEIFGYDFILDSDFNVWLIEVNTNPCLEESSDLLKMLLPRMIDDAFKLTLDQIFPNTTNIEYAIGGYDNTINMW